MTEWVIRRFKSCELIVKADVMRDDGFLARRDFYTRLDDTECSHGVLFDTLANGDWTTTDDLGNFLASCRSSDLNDGGVNVVP